VKQAALVVRIPLAILEKGIKKVNIGRTAIMALHEGEFDVINIHSSSGLWVLLTRITPVA
jgi:hypothetical protein